VFDKAGELLYSHDLIDENSSIGELLGTACGCEFDVETNIKD
jgi:hypothetical protein